MSSLIFPRSATAVRQLQLAALRPAAMQTAGLRTSVPAPKPAATAPNPPKVGMSQDENLNLLNKQRSIRPISPHLTIYRYPLNMYMSITNRITGAALSAGLYAGAIAYLALPYLGFLDTSLVPSTLGFIAGLPFWFKMTTKSILAVPFVYHTINGVRHLIWDSGRLLSNSSMDTSGYTVLALTGISTVGLVGWGAFW